MRLAVRLSVAVVAPVMLLAGPAGGTSELPESGLGPIVIADTQISGPGAVTDDFDPALAWNQAASEFLVIWTDDRNGVARGSDTYARRVGINGQPIGGDHRISGPRATSADLAPAVAWNGTDNEYLVIWSDSRDSFTRGSDIYARRVGADGTPIGGDHRISGPQATASDLWPAVAWDQTANEYLVVWQDQRNWSSRGDDIYGRRVGADGRPIGTDRRLSGPQATASDSMPDVVWNPLTREYLVVWHDARDATIRGNDIYARRVAADGLPIGGDHRVSGSKATSHETNAALACELITGQYLVVWEDWRDEPTRGLDIFARRVGTDGAPVGAERQISGPGATAEDARPDVAWNASHNRYLVVWQDGRNPAWGLDIYGRRVGADLSLAEDDSRISGTGATAHDQRPAIAWNRALYATTHQFLVVWTDGRNLATRGYDIYGRRMIG